jgi:UDP-N-acetylglucosamine--N-acetylmuramyl-(pentapeptide) pyrophosphoryl-undecaprenol N-acetylglucosamine transferase
VSKTICFTGGGTGGHVFPGLAVIRSLARHPDCAFIWIGSRTGMEREIVSQYGIPFYGVPCGKLRRYVSIRNVLDVFKVIAGFFASLGILARLAPNIVFSKGGYVSVPVVAAAGFLGIPVFTHESDFDPGIATRLNSIFAEKILTSFPETASFIPEKNRGKVVCTGNPIRASLLSGDPIKARAYVAARRGKKTVLVLGGSQGALAINGAVRAILDELLARCDIVHQTGKNDFLEIEKPGYFARPFFGEELADILSAASLVVSRAGSNTLWEIAAAGLPSILVPLSMAGSRGDQLRNAEVFERAGASIVISEGVSLSRVLLENISNLIDNEEVLHKMGVCALSISRKDAAENIASLLCARMLDSGVNT